MSYYYDYYNSLVITFVNGYQATYIDFSQSILTYEVLMHYSSKQTNIRIFVRYISNIRFSPNK